MKKAIYCCWLLLAAITFYSCQEFQDDIVSKEDVPAIAEFIENKFSKEEVQAKYDSVAEVKLNSGVEPPVHTLGDISYLCEFSESGLPWYLHPYVYEPDVPCYFGYPGPSCCECSSAVWYEGTPLSSKYNVDSYPYKNDATSFAGAIYKRPSDQLTRGREAGTVVICRDVFDSPNSEQCTNCETINIPASDGGPSAPINAYGETHVYKLENDWGASCIPPTPAPYDDDKYCNGVPFDVYWDGWIGGDSQQFLSSLPNPFYVRQGTWLV